MNTSMFNVLKNNVPVKLLLGSNPLRVYPYSRAPQNPRKPYATYGVVNANPENYLGQVPDIDNAQVQIDVYADTASQLESCFTAIRDALEPVAHMINYSDSNGVDESTSLYTVRMEFDFWEER